MEPNTAELKTLHKELWLWIAEQSDYLTKAMMPNHWIKAHWPKWSSYTKEYPIAYEYKCFACQYAEDKRKAINGMIHCRYCPINWVGTLHAPCIRCTSRTSLYNQWRNSKDPLELETLAEIIAFMWD